jgi:hypothetical protein
MSGSTTLFNIPANTLRPGPTLTIIRQADGKTTATMDFTCRKFDIGRTAIQSLLLQGTRLLTLYPQAGTEFDYMLLDSWTSRDEPGGITTVTCEFKGVDLAPGGDFSFDSSIVYSRNNSLKEESIWQNPKLIEELSITDIRAIKAVLSGIGYLADDGVTVKKNTTDEVIETLNDPHGIEWYGKIITLGHETYTYPTSEWTKTATGRGKLTSSALTKMGKIDDDVPGNPSLPPDQSWLLTGATENISVVGGGANSYSLTWTSGNWDTVIYTA